MTSHKRFIAAYDACLRRSPDKAPSPGDINKELGRSGHILSGVDTTLRRELLARDGFVKDSKSGRFRKIREDEETTRVFTGEMDGETELWLGETFSSWLPSRSALEISIDGQYVVVEAGATLHKKDGRVWTSR